MYNDVANESIELSNKTVYDLAEQKLLGILIDKVFIFQSHKNNYKHS